LVRRMLVEGTCFPIAKEGWIGKDQDQEARRNTWYRLVSECIHTFGASPQYVTPEPIYKSDVIREEH
jgi:hypothetical protein